MLERFLFESTTGQRPTLPVHSKIDMLARDADARPVPSLELKIVQDTPVIHPGLLIVSVCEMLFKH